MFLELPYVYVKIMNFMKEELSKSNPNVCSSFYNSKRWHTIKKKFGKKIVLGLFIYYDDFEINNPLSTAAGVYEIGGLYFTIAGLPPKYASMIENILLGLFLFTSGLKTFKNEKCFKDLFRELQDLFIDGITINVDGNGS